MRGIIELFVRNWYGNFTTSFCGGFFAVLSSHLYSITTVNPTVNPTHPTRRAAWAVQHGLIGRYRMLIGACKFRCMVFCFCFLVPDSRGAGNSKPTYCRSRSISPGPTCHTRPTPRSTSCSSQSSRVPRWAATARLPPNHCPGTCLHPPFLFTHPFLHPAYPARDIRARMSHRLLPDALCSLVFGVDGRTL